ncbi:MAG: alpha/beta hydrolase family protein [Janthinobacterium lividum]
MAENYTLSQDVLAGDLPTLTIARDDLAKDAPLVIALHGLGGRKETMLPGLYAFARAGCRVVAFDVQWHGERPGAAERETRLQTDFFTTTGEMIQGTAHDISRLLDALGADRAAIHGISLGGYIAFTALMLEPRLQVASVAIGSPDWTGPMRKFGLSPGNPIFDMALSLSPLTLLPAALPPRPLLMQHGTLDETVSVDGVIALEKSLRPLYAANPERMHLELYPNLGHVYTDGMQKRAEEWITRFMGETNNRR